MKHAIHKVQWAVVHRTNDVGIDLPPGTCATDLQPADYHPIEMGPLDEPEPAQPAHVRFTRLTHRHRRRS